jgi:hypothetical protein
VVVLEFLEWLEGLWHKRQGSCGIWEFFRDFVDFLSVWSASGPICNYFSEADSPAIKFSNAQAP